MAIIKFKTRKNIYSSKQLTKYVLTDKGRIKNPFAMPIVLQNINRLELETMHKDFLENHKYTNKRTNGNQILHEIVALHKDDAANNTITPEMLQDMMETYIKMRGAENALVIAKSHDDQHIHFMIGNNEYCSSKSLRMSHQQMKDLLRNFEQWHKTKYPQLTKSIIHTTPEREKNRHNSRDIASENRNTRREKEYAMKIRTPGKKSQKEIVSEMTATILQKARSFSKLEEYIKQVEELELYTYRGELRGILFKSRKYRFSTLGISREELLPLENHQKRLEELNLIKEMHKKTREQQMELER